MRGRGAFVAIAAALLAGCGVNDILRAGGDVGTAARAGAAAFTPAFAIATDVCRRRAELDFLQHRVEGSDPWGTGVGWAKWYETHASPPPGGTWKESCARVSQGDEILLAALRVLAAYGDALHAFTTGEDVNGDDVRALAAGAAGTAANLSKDPSTKGKLGSAGSALGEALAAFAGVIAEKMSANETRNVVAKSDAKVQAILQRMTDYASATEEQLDDEERRLAGVLLSVEAKMKADPSPGPIAALSFADFARRNERAIRADRKTLAAFRETLHALGEAHANLARGSANKDSAALATASRRAAETILRAGAEGRVLLIGGDR
jgi:hypothetical protein